MTIKYRDADDVRVIADRYIDQYHGHLLNAKIKYVFTSQKRKSCDRAVLATASRVSPLTKFLTSSKEKDGWDFVIMVGEEEWAGLNAKQREALVDHELSHCGYDDEKDKWRILGHDLEEFVHIVGRHGHWTPELKDLQHVAKIENWKDVSDDDDL